MRNNWIALAIAFLCTSSVTFGANVYEAMSYQRHYAHYLQQAYIQEMHHAYHQQMHANYHQMNENPAAFQPAHIQQEPACLPEPREEENMRIIIKNKKHWNLKVPEWMLTGVKQKIPLAPRPQEQAKSVESRRVQRSSEVNDEQKDCFQWDSDWLKETRDPEIFLNLEEVFMGND